MAYYSKSMRLLGGITDNEQANYDEVTEKQLLEFTKGGIKDENGQNYADRFVEDIFKKLGINVDDNFVIKYNETPNFQRYTPQLSFEDEGLTFRYVDNIPNNQEVLNNNFSELDYLKFANENELIAPNVESYKNAINNHNEQIEINKELEDNFVTKSSEYSKIYDDYMKESGKFYFDSAMDIVDIASNFIPQFKILTIPYSIHKFIKDSKTNKSLAEKSGDVVNVTLGGLGELSQKALENVDPKMLGYLNTGVDVLDKSSTVGGILSNAYDITVNNPNEIAEFERTMVQPYNELLEAEESLKQGKKQLDIYKEQMNMYNPFNIFVDDNGDIFDLLSSKGYTYEDYIALRTYLGSNEKAINTMKNTNVNAVRKLIEDKRSSQYKVYGMTDGGNNHIVKKPINNNTNPLYFYNTHGSTKNEEMINNSLIQGSTTDGVDNSNFNLRRFLDDKGYTYDDYTTLSKYLGSDKAAINVMNKDTVYSVKSMIDKQKLKEIEEEKAKERRIKAMADAVRRNEAEKLNTVPAGSTTGLSQPMRAIEGKNNSAVQGKTADEIEEVYYKMKEDEEKEKEKKANKIRASLKPKREFK